MAATSKTRSYDRLLTTTSDLYYKSGIVQDNIFQSNPLFHCLHGKEDGIRMEDAGGDFIKCGLMYEENGNFDSYSGYDILDDTPQDGITSAFFPWAQYSGANVIDGLSKFKNTGRAKIVDLWTEVIKQTMYTGQERLNKDLLDVANVTFVSPTTGNGGKNIQGLPIMVNSAPTTSTYTYGGVDCNAETWWANRTYDGASIALWSDLYGAMLNLYNDCSRGGGGSPDIVLADQVTYESYVKYLDDKIRYEYTDTPSAGFENVRAWGAKMFWDVYMPNVDAGSTVQNGGDGVTLTAGTVYMLNSKAMNLVVGKGLDFKPQGVRKAERQDALREYVLFYGQLITNNRRKHGVLWDIEPALTKTA